MYKALDVRDNTEVVILDQKWLQSISELRELDHHDFLVCQGCKQPVRVRAGEQRRKHFAHKHLENCDYGEESSILRNYRAVLYEWLVSKFGENVTIEKKIDEINLFRPIDCWVKQDSTVFAYWIFDSRLKSEKRDTLQDHLAKLGIHVNWVFALEMLRTEQDHSDMLILSTTEREFIQDSKYDATFSNGYPTTGSLHYLDIENHKLLTFRGLSLYHKPQIYKGYNLTSELEKVLVSPKNGEFVHSGEYEELQKYNQKLKNSNKKETLTVINEVALKRNSTEIPLQNSLFKPVKCEFCGEITDEWWSYDGKTGLCKCLSCQKQGMF